MIKKVSISAIAALAFAAFFFWLTCAPINYKSPEFWTLFIFTVGVFCFVYLLFSIFGRKKVIVIEPKKRVGKAFRNVAIIIVGLFLLLFIGGISGAEIFNAKHYRDQLTMKDSDFSTDIKEISFSQIPIADKDTAQRLANRQVGSVVDLVSQFNLSNKFSVINYENKPYRVTPLEYADIFKWLSNSSKGIPYYIKVNLATQEANIVKLDKPMKYGMSDKFNRYVVRKARLSYPTKLFDEVNFEIDDSGHPFWVFSVIDYKIGLYGGPDAVGVVLVDAVTGDTSYYDISKVPQWIDRAYGTNLILKQINNNGKYKHGFWNSKFGQKDVLQTTDGYNYLSINNNIWLYTGLTSVVSDESNIGFTLVNLRTKESRFYAINGAEEYSAMASAEGKVQEKRYTATFPLLINVDNYPTYFLSLKDSAGLVKMYAFINVENYQVVGVAESIDEAKEQYVRQLSGEGLKPTGDDKTVEGAISFVSSAVKDGNSYYYVKLDGNDTVYTASIQVSDLLPVLQTGNKVKISYRETGGKTASISKIELVQG
ncbi:MAG: CvpA family protein [Bacillota bacterium]|nr:CvpA family protein [Bacillota bacterium]